MLNAGELAGWMQKHKMKNFSGAPFNPPTQGKIERDYQTIKNRVLLENDCPQATWSSWPVPLLFRIPITDIMKA